MIRQSVEETVVPDAIKALPRVKVSGEDREAPTPALLYCLSGQQRSLHSSTVGDEAKLQIVRYEGNL